MIYLVSGKEFSFSCSIGIESGLILFRMDTTTVPEVFSFASPLLSSNIVNLSEGKNGYLLLFQDFSLCLYDHIHSCYGYRALLDVDRRILSYKEIYETQSHILNSECNTETSPSIRGDLFEHGYRFYIDHYGYLYLYVGTGEVIIYSLFLEDPQPCQYGDNLFWYLNRSLEEKESIEKGQELIKNYSIHCFETLQFPLLAVEKSLYKISNSYSLLHYIYHTYFSVDQPLDSEENQAVYFNEFQTKEQNIKQLLVELNKYDIYDVYC